jgi:tetratricopeptide (TPR) repeat protein
MSRSLSMLTFLAVFWMLQAEPQWSELIATAVQQERLGEYQKANTTLSMALAVAKRENLPPREQAITLNNLGSVQISLGNFVEAERNLNRALTYLQTGDSNEWTWALNHLGIVYHATGRLREAENAYRRVMECRQQTLDARDPALARSYANLGGLLVERHRNDEARELLIKALENLDMSPGTEGDWAHILLGLSTLHKEERDYQRAAATAQRAVEILEASAKQAHPLLGISLSAWGAIRLAQGQNEAARDLLSRSIQILTVSFPRGHPALTEALFTYATALAKSGRKGEAKQARQQASAMLAVQQAADLTRHRVSLVELGPGVK